jgi:hypothetical protein
VKEKVNSLLSFAYDVRDLHLGELFLAERRFRRDVVALELQRIAIREARSRVSEDYSTLAEVKGLLNQNGFQDDVRRFAAYREASGAYNQPPTNFAFLYGSPGTHVVTLLSGANLASKALTTLSFHPSKWFHLSDHPQFGSPCTHVVALLSSANPSSKALTTLNFRPPKWFHLSDHPQFDVGMYYSSPCPNVCFLFMRLLPTVPASDQL